MLNRYSRRHARRGRGESASLPRLGISPVVNVLSWLAIAVFQIYGDPVVVRFIGSGKTEKNVETQQAALQRMVKRYADLNNGTGSWAIIEKASEQIVGAILLKQLPDNEGQLTQDYEVGWHLRQTFWGRGYATEAAKAAIAHGFQTLQLPIIYAVVRPENIPSVRVTRRLGMKPEGRSTKYYGVELELFSLVRP
jgi:ribosomal-protein-alanine N-acetyltransferase